MKILMTGFTAQHCGRDNRPGYEPTTRMVANALRAMGHKVDQCAFDPQEHDVRIWDLCLVGMYPVGGLAAQHIYGALECITQCAQLEHPVAFIFDDWNVRPICLSPKTFVKEPKRLIKPLFDYRRDYDWATKHMLRMVEACELLSDPTLWPACLLPLYPGGDIAEFGKYIPRDKIASFNPSSLVPKYEGTPVGPDERECQWIFGVLSNQQKWLEKLGCLEWPIVHRGAKASKAPVFIKESELYKLMCSSWGSLSCPYYHSGSGWFRIRHVLARRAGCLIAGDSKELAFMGQSFQITPHQIEALDYDEIVDLQTFQAHEWDIAMARSDIFKDLKLALGL